MGGKNNSKIIEETLGYMESFSYISIVIRMIVMKRFEDLVFSELPDGFGVQSHVMFDSGFGASVVKGPHTYGGKMGLYEIAVLDSDGYITYETPVTSDVIGYLRPEDVTDVMEKIQKL